MTSHRKTNPETIQQREIVRYLALCRLGKVRRVNTGMLRAGNAPAHPWAKDTRRVVRFGEKGHSDLVLELAGDPRSVFIEVKALGWKPPQPPKPDATGSTRQKYRHYLEQAAFLEAQRQRGHFGFIARSALEVYQHLVNLGFQGLPVPGGVASVRPKRRTQGLNDLESSKPARH